MCFSFRNPRDVPMVSKNYYDYEPMILEAYYLSLFMYAQQCVFFKQ